MWLVFSAVARDATPTKQRLIRAAEHQFARDGVGGARIAVIIRAAGQANDSAVRYHFGSRAGLLDAVVAEHVAAMEGCREVPTAEDGLHELVSKLVAPAAHLLNEERGRDFLRIMEQLAGFSGVATGRAVDSLTGTVLDRQLRAIVDLLAEEHGLEMARERVATMVTFLAAALADRARTVEASRRLRLSHARFVDHLVAMLVGALAA